MGQGAGPHAGFQTSSSLASPCDTVTVCDTYWSSEQLRSVDSASMQMNTYTHTLSDMSMYSHIQYTCISRYAYRHVQAHTYAWKHASTHTHIPYKYTCTYICKTFMHMHMYLQHPSWKGPHVQIALHIHSCTPMHRSTHIQKYTHIHCGIFPP